MRTSTHLLPVCSSSRDYIYSLAVWPSRLHLLARGLPVEITSTRGLPKYAFMRTSTHHEYEEYPSSNPACASHHSSEFCYFKASSWHSTCMPSSVRPPGRPQIPVLLNSAKIVFYPKKLGCDVVVKLLAPLLSVYNEEGIVRDGYSSDVMALEHTPAALHFDSGCGEDGILVDVLFWNMLACCCGV
jgi:hypothetical protein